MTRELPPVERLITWASPSEGVQRRLHALWDLQKHGTAAVTAVPVLVDTLDDESTWHQRVPPDFDGEWHDSYYFPAEAAVHALAVIAPDAAIDRVARTVARLHGRVEGISHTPDGGTWEERITWRKQGLAPFGAALVEALRALADHGPEELRANAAAVLKVLMS